MHVAKLRMPAEENGLVAVGTYFERLSKALREANERASNSAPEQPRVAARRSHPHPMQMEMSL